MENQNQQKTKKIIAIVLVLLLLISIGYAALTTNLSINGTAILKKQTWSVYFDNVQVKAGSVSGTKVIEAPTTSGTTTTNLTWEVSMDTPGEFYEYNVDVVNGGTIDAMVETATNLIVTSSLTEAQAKYLDYSIKYVNGADIEQYDKLAAGERKTITVKLLFKNDETVNPADLPATAQNGILLNYETNYIQADNRAVEKSTIVTLPIGSSVNYVTSLNNVELNNWKVLYVDGNYTYLIYGDYLPTSAIDSGSLGISKSSEYGVYSNTSRIALLNTLNTKSNWDSLLTGTINGTPVNETRSENVWAMGSPTLDLFINSWNSNEDHVSLYTAQTSSSMSDGLFGNYIGKSANPNSSSVGISNAEGYNDQLYFPRKTVLDNTIGYWLTSPSSTASYIMTVDFMGYISSYPYSSSNDCLSIRPVICLPSNIVSQ